MDLRKFIAETLTQIIGGINDAQQNMLEFHKGKNESKVEWNYPVEMPQLTEDQIRQIEILLDPHFKERKDAEEYFKNRFINPFIIARKKFGVLKKVNDAIDKKIQKEEYPSDVIMQLLYEDSIKQCAISFSEIAKKLLSL